jgi:LPS export ABC transporter protein LptC
MILKKITALTILAVMVTACACAQASGPQESEQQIMDFSLAGFGEKGKKNWDISGKSADIVTDTVNLKDVVGNLYGESEDIKLTADKGAFNKKDGQVYLQDNVLIATSGGAKMTTNSLNWDRKNQVVTTEDAVNIERENMIASALGAVGQPNLRKVSLQKEVQVQIDQMQLIDQSGPSQKSRIVITCEGPMEIDYQKSVATFNKKVKVDTSDATIYSDVMEVHFAKSEKKKSDISSALEPAASMATQVDKIMAYGNVTIIQGENISQSNEAVYTASSNKITLSGKPKLVIYSDNDLSQSFEK